MSERRPNTFGGRGDRDSDGHHSEDVILVERLIAGCRSSWETLLERHERTVYYAVVNTLRSYSNPAAPDVVEDLQAEVFVELVRDDFRKLRRYSGRSKLSHWLKVVASNYTVDFLRKKRPSMSLNEDTAQADRLRRSLVSSRPAPDARLWSRERGDMLRELTSSLSPSDQRFVALFYGLELSFDEIATEMDTTVGAIYARKNRVRKKLRALAIDAGYVDR